MNEMTRAGKLMKIKDKAKKKKIKKVLSKIDKTVEGMFFPHWMN